MAETTHTPEMTEADEQRLRQILDDMRREGAYGALSKEGSTRLKKAEVLYREGAVTVDAAGLYHVCSASDKEPYTIDHEKAPYTIDRACDCAFGRNDTARWCSHRLAAAVHRKMHASFPNGRRDNEKDHPARNAPGSHEEPSHVHTCPTCGLAVDCAHPQCTLDEITLCQTCHQRPYHDPQEPGLTPAGPTLPQEPASLRRSIVAIIADLSRPLPEACVATLPATQKRPAQKYLHWWNVATLLDTYAPGWSGSVARIEKIGDKCSVTYRITIPALEGECVREDSGMEDEDADGYGDTMTNATATAFKRAAAKFGVARYLYAANDQTAKALAEHLRQEREASIADVCRLAKAQEVDTDKLNVWLHQQIPQGAIHRLQGQLQRRQHAA